MTKVKELTPRGTHLTLEASIKLINSKRPKIDLYHLAPNLQILSPVYPPEFS